jgi:2-oxoisovalerate dehydrogenase E1 component
MFGGVASDISAMIMEECFKFLGNQRVASLDTPIPLRKP